MKERDRLIRVNWGQVRDVYPIDIIVEAWNRVGLLKDISTVVAEEKINIANINLVDRGEEVTLYFTLDVKDMPQLNNILMKINTVSGVIGADRIRSQTRASIQ